MTINQKLHKNDTSPFFSEKKIEEKKLLKISIVRILLSDKFGESPVICQQKMMYYMIQQKKQISTVFSLTQKSWHNFLPECVVLTIVSMVQYFFKEK